MRILVLLFALVLLGSGCQPVVYYCDSKPLVAFFCKDRPQSTQKEPTAEQFYPDDEYSKCQEFYDDNLSFEKQGFIYTDCLEKNSYQD